MVSAYGVHVVGHPDRFGLHRPDPNAFEIGPTGLAYDPETDTLYVASTGDNEIFAVPNAASRTYSDAGQGQVIYQMTRITSRAARAGAGPERRPDHGQWRRG